jgi:branched-chain amino acid transport system substrate-binding protein
MSQNKVFASSLMVVALSVAIAGCNKSSNTPNSATSSGGSGKEALRIGVIQSATGGAAAYGDAHTKGTQLAFEEINKAGGVNGMPLQVFIEDDKSDPATGINDAKKLISQDKVNAIVGSDASLVTIAFSKENEKSKVPLVNGMAGSPTITEQGYKYTWRINVTDSQLDVKTIEHYMTKLGKKKFAFLAENSDYGKPPTKAAVEKIKELGGEVLAYEEYNRGETDFKAQLTNIKNTNPEVVFLHGYYTEGSIIARQIKELGIKSDLIINMGQGVPKYVELAGAAAEGAVFPTTWVPGLTDERSKKFEAAFRAKFNAEPGAFEAGSYEAVYTVIEAVKKGGGVSSEQIQTGLKQLSGFNTLLGKMKFNEKNQNDGEVRFATFKGGKIVPLQESAK